MDEPKQPVRNWPRLVKSGIGQLRSDQMVASGYSRMVERVGPLTERQAKCLDEVKRQLGRMQLTINHLDMLVRWSEGPVGAVKVAVVELLPILREVAAGLPVHDADSPWEVRTEPDGVEHAVVANAKHLKLLIEKVSLCVWHALRSERPTICVKEPLVSSLAEYWVIIAGADQLERASNVDDLVPLTDDRASSLYALDIAAASCVITASGGRVLCFREKIPGAVIALPRA